MTLRDAELHKFYKVLSVCGKSKQALRLMDMGFTKGCELYVMSIAPSGGAVLVELRGFVVALRDDAAALVEVALKHEV